MCDQVIPRRFMELYHNLESGHLVDIPVLPPQKIHNKGSFETVSLYQHIPFHIFLHPVKDIVSQSKKNFRALVGKTDHRE